MIFYFEGVFIHKNLLGSWKVFFSMKTSINFIIQPQLFGVFVISEVRIVR